MNGRLLWYLAVSMLAVREGAAQEASGSIEVSAVVASSEEINTFLTARSSLGRSRKGWVIVNVTY